MNKSTLAASLLAAALLGRFLAPSPAVDAAPKTALTPGTTLFKVRDQPGASIQGDQVTLRDRDGNTETYVAGMGDWLVMNPHWGKDGRDHDIQVTSWICHRSFCTHGMGRMRLGSKGPKPLSAEYLATLRH